MAKTDPTEMSISSGQDDERHPERDDEHRQVGEEEVVQVVAREEARRGQGEHEPERHDGEGDGGFAAVDMDTAQGSGLQAQGRAYCPAEASETASSCLSLEP